MPGYAMCEAIITSQFLATRGNEIVFYLEGGPGCGKSALAKAIGANPRLAFDYVLQFFPSLRENVDLLGSPWPNDEVTRWRPPEELKRLEKGRCLLILDELSDAPVSMQNPLCGLMHDRKVGSLTLSGDLFIIATGNRTKDRSGATRLISKLANRMTWLQFTPGLDDWRKWGMDNNIDPRLLAFMPFRPELFNQFDPSRDANPTPRSWEKVALAPTDMPADQYLLRIAGDVGEGPAAEYVAFCNLYGKLPDPRSLIADPKHAPVPDALDQRYAIVGAVSRLATKANFDAVFTYLKRMSASMCVLGMRDAVYRDQGLRQTRAFAEFIKAFADVMV